MSQIIPLTELNARPRLFQDREIDNDGFFQTMEEWLSSIQWVPEIWKQTRLELFELKWLFVQMKKQKFIRGVTEWTALEQEKFFKKIQSEVVDFWMAASVWIKEKIQFLIENEIWREINDDGKKYSLQDGDGNTMIPNIGEYQKFLDTSFLLTKETSITPMDLRLTVGHTETIADAKKKLDRYNGKYNALVLIDNDNRPIGIVKYDMLKKHESMGSLTLEKIIFIPDLFWYYTTSSNSTKETMQQFWINILPIIDSKTGILIGILTDTTIARHELQYYSTTSLTELSLDCLRLNT